jgi:putative transcriptional regulator
MRQSICTVDTNFSGAVVLVVRLRDAMEAYRKRTGERLTYEALAERTGLARSTLESLASRPSYNTRLSTIDRLCRALGCQPGELLGYHPDKDHRNGN